MQLERHEQNPFDMVKASDFTDEEILDHWVDISGEHGGLTDVIKPRLVMPMLLLGGKGSGKTHLMRYLSAPVQAARFNNDLLKAASVEQYIGVYVRAEGLNTNKFCDKGQSAEAWSAIFSHYFEIWLATSLMQNIAPALLSIDNPDRSAAFAAAAAALFDDDVTRDFQSYSALVDYLISTRKQIDLVVNNAALTREIHGLKVDFSPGSLVFGLPKVIGDIYPELKSTLFVYLIDEVENLTSDQQRFLNTLIRYRRGNSSIKIGARLYGMRTYETLGVGEPIKRDAEYERVELDSFLRDHEKAYAEFCKSLIIRRLEHHNMRALRLSSDSLSRQFEEIEVADFSRASSLSLVNTWDKDGRERPYFVRLRSLLKAGGYENDVSDRLADALRVHGSPLLEKLALFQMYRNWKEAPDDLETASVEIGHMARALEAGGRPEGDELRRVLGYYRSDLLAQLYRDCRRAIPYAGLDTLIHLSQGIPRNLLSILKHIYRRSLFAGERPFAGGSITVESQSLGVKDSAAWFWEDAQPDHHGFQVREAIEILATFFRTMRYSDRPSECDCATFSTRLESLSDQSREILKTAENWSYLIRIRGGASDKNDDAVNAKYQLSPMLAPRWGVSEHRRGTVEISTEFGNAIFDTLSRSTLQPLFRKRVEGWLGEKFVKTRSNGQERLFA